MATEFPLPPPGMRVPQGGSCCANCVFISENGRNCLSPNYIKLSYKGKKKGDDRFIDGKTGDVVTNPFAFCCNAYDWER